MLIYILEKAEHFLKEGYLLYRNKDFFHQPPVDVTPEEHKAMYEICQQISDQKGVESFLPLSGGFADLQLFAQMMHCLIVDSDEESIQLQHALHPEMEGVLYCIFTDMTPSNRPVVRFPFERQPDSTPMYPLVEYQPMLISSRLIKSGAIQDCWYQLHIDCKTNSSIGYQSLLFCIDPSREQPCFIVSEEIGMDCLFLCTFDDSGHHNYGECSFETMDEFFEHSMLLLKDFLAQSTPEYPISISGNTGRLSSQT
jgi:hypothetical protein